MLSTKDTLVVKRDLQGEQGESTDQGLLKRGTMVPYAKKSISLGKDQNTVRWISRSSALKLAI